jgi:hypothetical protein
MAPDELAKTRHERGRCACGVGTLHVQADFVGYLSRLCVEVVLDLHVVGDEADRHHDDTVDARLAKYPQVVAHVRLEPRLCGWPAAALEGEIPRRPARTGRNHTLGDQSGGFV